MTIETGYGINYGSQQSTTNPGETPMTLLEQNDEFVLSGTTLKATNQVGGLNLYIHITHSDDVIILQPNHEDSNEYQIIEIKAEGIALLKAILNEL